MTEQEFIEELKNIKDKFKWEILNDGCIIAKDTENIMFCPITALYKIKDNDYVRPSLYRFAAQKLNIESKVADNIVTAADHDNSFLEAERCHKEKELRNNMLNILKLR